MSRQANGHLRARRGRATALAIIALAGALAAAAGACSKPAASPHAIMLIDGFDVKMLEDSPPEAAVRIPRTEWRFDGTPPRTPPRPGAAAGSPAPAPFAATRGFEAGPGVAGLAIEDGLLTGRTTSALPILRIERTTGLDDPDQVYAIEIRLRVSAGANLFVVTRPAPTVDLNVELAQATRVTWTITTPIVAGDKLQTYTITPPAPFSASRVRHLLIRPTDVAGAEFAIESLRLITRREHLAGTPSGLSWQGLRDIFHETLVTRTPEKIRIPLTLPSRPMLDLALGTPEDEPVTFKVTVRRGEVETPVLTWTTTTPHRWEHRIVDLAQFAGASVTISLSAHAEREATLAFWGEPAVRQRFTKDTAGGPPQGVILVQLDTLRTDHLDVYGYERPTAPNLRRLAEEGALFRHAVTQTSWTKAATPSVLASLYPSTHGVHQIPDRLPASATTIAEVYRQAGYATVSFSSVAFTGQLTNLHQGFEELHESESTVGRAGPRGSKTAREYVDRLVDWLDDHHDVPFFVYLHFFDPHSPYEPNRPFDTMWADPNGRDEYLRQLEVLKKVVADGFLAQRGMATREELQKAGIDPEAFIRYSKDWYDGSIRGMDTEIGRLVERLSNLGLADRTAIAFYADHGEEFHDHGRMWHGQSVYGEMIRVPLIFWAPGRVAKGLKIEEPAQLIDVMPTLLDLSGLRSPETAQGQSLRSLLVAGGAGGQVAAGGGFQKRPVIAEKHPLGTGTDFPNVAESYAIMDGGFKLIHNVVRPEGKPEFELFDFYKDPLDQRNIAAENPEVVGRLTKLLFSFRQMAGKARLKSDDEATKGMTREQLEHLRSLGYVK
jgi:arylsulfatase A-like enzyme